MIVRLLTILVLAVALWGCRETSPTNEQDVWAGCNWIAIEDIYQNPVAYNGTQVCTEGTLRAGYESMHLVPAGLITSELTNAALDAPVGFLEALQEHLYTGDVMQVAGVLEIAEHCLPDTSSIDEEIGATFCMPHALPMTLVNAQHRVTSQVSLRDQCAQIDLNEIYDQSIYLDWRLVCTEGQLVETDGAYSLIPVNSTLDDLEIPLEVTASYAGVETNDLAGQNISVVGWIASDFFCERWIDEEPHPSRQPTDDCELDVGSFTILLAEVSAIE